MSPTANINTLQFSDEELKALNDVVRQSKVTASAEELLLIRLGKFNSPLLDVVYKVGIAWETRNNEIQNPVVAAPDTDATNVTSLSN